MTEQANPTAQQAADPAQRNKDIMMALAERNKAQQKDQQRKASKIAEPEPETEVDKGPDMTLPYEAGVDFMTSFNGNILSFKKGQTLDDPFLIRHCFKNGLPIVETKKCGQCGQTLPIAQD